MTVICIALASCSFRVPRDPGWLVLGIPSDPDTLNNITRSTANANTVLGFMMESLTDLNPETMEDRPMLAERWDISPNGLQFTFHLRHDVKWHDGAPFTADDVIYSYEKIMDPKVDAAPSRVYLNDVKQVEKLDQYTIRFTFREPYYKAFTSAAWIPIVPRHVFDDGTDFNAHPAGRRPIGTGPYQFVEWASGRHIVLRRNPNYWGTPPAIDGVVFRIIPEQNVSFQALKKGEVDNATLRAVQWSRQTSGRRFNEKFQKLRYFTPGYAFIGWNLRRPLFQDRRVRQALTMLIDRESLLQKIMYGEGMIVSGNFYPFHPSYDRSIEPWPYNPSRAAELLKEAGWVDHDGDGWRDKDGIPFRFVFSYSAGSRFADALASIMRESFREIGIHVEPQQMEWTTFIKTVDEHNFDAIQLAWLGGSVEDDSYQVWHSSQAEKGSNVVGFVNAEADRLIIDARRNFDPKQRAELYHQFHRIVHEEQPYTFLFCFPQLEALHKRFTNVNVYTLGIDWREWGVNRNVQLWQ